MKPSSAQIKFIRSLSQKKFRDKSGLFVIEGEKLLQEALDSGFGIEEIYRREEIGEECMQRISSLSSGSPVLALVRKPEGLGEMGEIPSRGLYIGLDGLRDPGNLGTIIRIADWYGIKDIYASPDSVDVFNPKVVQATMGAIFRVRFHYTSIPELCKAFIEAGGYAYGTFLDGEDMYSMQLECGTDAPVLLITGSESHGISREVAECVSGRLYIPSYHPAGETGAESLNAAVATAITVAEFRRRLR